MYKIIEKSKIWFCLSLTIIIIGMGFLAVRGLNFGIDFKGGTEISIQLNEDIDKADVDAMIKQIDSQAVTTLSDKYEYDIKAADFDSDKVDSVMDQLNDKYSIDKTALISQNEIGASIGKELTQNSLLALGAAFIVMLIYIAIRFEFRYGIAAIVATFHDILITVSFYAIFNIPVNTPFIAAILTIIGYSMNDTIVIFDRIRENNKIMRRADINEIADTSLTETMSRSINTSLSTLVTIIAINIMVPTVREFTVPLIIGIITGAYSSIFIASPVWVLLKTKIRGKNHRNTNLKKA